MVLTVRSGGFGKTKWNGGGDNNEQERHKRISSVSYYHIVPYNYLKDNIKYKKAPLS